MTEVVYNSLVHAKQQNEKKFAVLIDPDKIRLGNLEQVLELAKIARVDYFLLGGSLVVHDMMDYCIETIRKSTNIPVILFPGSPQQINNKADAIFFLSLISGRNADLLIGQHVLSAAALKKSLLEVISTGYMLIDGGTPTTASYISNTHPIPANKDEIAYCTALAGELLGLKTIYMDAGSGAKNPITESMIHNVSKSISIPLIIGGGIRTPEKALANAQAGADVIVVGNAIEKDPNLLIEIADAIHSANKVPISRRI
jgi:phosphoglycerol geranylgeranyltransferase